MMPFPPGLMSSSRIFPTRLALSDFKNGVYELSGSPADVDDLWEQNVDYGDWNPATDIIAGKGMHGVANVGGYPASTSGLWALINGGCTVIVTYAQTTFHDFATDNTYFEFTNPAGYDPDFFVTVPSNDIEYNEGAGAGDIKLQCNDESDVNIGVVSLARHKIALNVRATTMVASYDGGTVSAPQVADLAGATIFAITNSDNDKTIESVEFLDLVRDVDLPGLSQVTA